MELTCVGLLGNEVDSLANSLDLIGFLVRYEDGEFVFDFHNNFDSVERVETQVLREGGIVCDLHALGSLAVRL